MKLKISYDTRKKILDRTQYYGLTGLGWILRGLTRVLFGSETWKGFSSLSTTAWIRESARYSLPFSTIAGIDKALKDNFSPEEAVDRLARKAGVSKKEIKDSKLWVDGVISEHEFLERNRPMGADLDARQEALEANIANSVGKA